MPTPQPYQVGQLSQFRDEEIEVQRSQVPSLRLRSPEWASGLELWPRVWSRHAEEEAGVQPCCRKRIEGVCSLTHHPGLWSVNETELSGCGRQNRMEEERQNQREGGRERAEGPERGVPSFLADGDGRSLPVPTWGQGRQPFCALLSLLTTQSPGKSVQRAGLRCPPLALRRGGAS